MKLMINVHVLHSDYSITCIQRPPKVSNNGGLIKQVIFKCRLYWVDLSRKAVSEEWSLKAGIASYRWSLTQV